MMKFLTLILFAIGGIILGYSLSSVYPTRVSLAAELNTPNFASSTPNTDIGIPDLLLLNQLFNKGRVLQPNNRPLKFSDLVVLDKLFVGQTGDLLGANNNTKLRELLVLNQLFNNGKPLSQISDDDFKNLLLWYLILVK